MRFRLAVVMLIAVAIPVAHAAPSGADMQLRSRSCNISGGPANDKSVPLGELVVNAFTHCSTARRAIHHGQITKDGFRTKGWSCHAIHRLHVGSVTTGETPRCSRGRKSFSFSWAT